MTCPQFCSGGLVDWKQNGRLVGNGTLESRPALLEKVTCSSSSRQGARHFLQKSVNFNIE